MPATVTGDIQVATYVTDPVARRIDEAARAEGLSRAAWVRSRILRALAYDASRDPARPAA